MLLFNRLAKALKNTKGFLSEEPIYEDEAEDYYIGEGVPTEDDCLVDLDSDDPSIFDSVSNHNNEIIRKRRESEESSETTHQPPYEGDHVITKGVCLGVIDSDIGKTISIEDAKSGLNNECTLKVFSKPTCTEVPEFKTTTTTEDTSGKTKSNVTTFLEKYAEGNDTMQVLRYDLMKILSDIQWIKESGNLNEQFSLDLLDALNELSVSF